MCGIFGYIGYENPSVQRLRKIAVDTEERGKDAFGVAWVDENGIIRRRRAIGPASERLDILVGALKSRALIGHCRFATQGPADSKACAHPHAARDGYLVHNGTIAYHVQDYLESKVKVDNACDSALLAQAAGLFSHWGVPQFGALLEAADSSCALLGLWTNPVRVILGRAGNPLYIATDGVKGVYFASRPYALPQTAVACLDDKTVVSLAITPEGKLDMRSASLREALDRTAAGAAFVDHATAGAAKWYKGGSHTKKHKPAQKQVKHKPAKGKRGNPRKYVNITNFVH